MVRRSTLHTRKRSFTDRQLLCAALAFVIMGGLIAIVTARHRLPSSSLSGTAAAQENRKSVSEVRFYVYDEGINPRAIHAREGMIRLTYRAFVNDEEGVLVVPDKDGEPDLQHPITKIERDRRSKYSSQIIKLDKGRYWIVVKSNPKSRSLLTVE